MSPESVLSPISKDSTGQFPCKHVDILGIIGTIGFCDSQFAREKNCLLHLICFLRKRYDKKKRPAGTKDLKDAKQFGLGFGPGLSVHSRRERRRMSCPVVGTASSERTHYPETCPSDEGRQGSVLVSGQDRLETHFTVGGSPCCEKRDY